MPRQSELIGPHPDEGNFFHGWLSCQDIPATATKVHRSLTSQLETTDSKVIEWFGRKLFDHHHSEYRIEQLKKKFGDIGYPKYAEQNRRLPRDDKTKKGNAAEVLLVEYVETCVGRKLAKAFKLRYNPNADQAMKGDDTLLIDVITHGDKKVARVYLGEAKFRKTPTKEVVEDITKLLSKDKKPTSYTFVVDELGRNSDTRELADILDDFLIEEIMSDGNLICAGFLLSNQDTSEMVETNLNSDNPNFVLVSVSMTTPEDLIEEAFIKAQYFIDNPLDI